MMKKLFLTIIAVALFGQAVAQSGDHCVAYSVQMFANHDKFSDESMRTLELKSIQIISRSNAAKTTLYGSFIIVPIVDLIDTRSVMAGTQDITVVEAELTLVAKNLIDNSIYGSVTVKLEGSGKTEAKALNNLFQSINPTMPAYVKFIKNATQQIIDYYNDNMNRVLTYAETLINAKEYDLAARWLSSIPMCVPAFTTSQAAINSLITTIAKQDCTSAIEMANRYIAIGNYEEAKSILLSVPSGADCEAEIQKLLLVIKEKETESSKIQN